jgi:hypothetical protein
MGEYRLGVGADVNFDLVPVSRVIAYLLAIRADGQQPAQRFDLGKRV